MSSYGHDIYGAIQRGHQRRAEECLNDALRHMSQRGSKTPRFMFSMALNGLFAVTARMGITAEEIREVLNRALERTDSLTIEHYIEKYAHERGRPGSADGPAEFFGQPPCTHCGGTSYEPRTCAKCGITNNNVKERDRDGEGYICSKPNECRARVKAL